MIARVVGLTMMRHPWTPQGGMLTSKDKGALFPDANWLTEMGSGPMLVSMANTRPARAVESWFCVDEDVGLTGAAAEEGAD